MCNLEKRTRALLESPLPLTACGATAKRLQNLFNIGHEDLSLAKMVEAHWDAVAILTEAGRKPGENLLYGVWASEIPNEALTLHKNKSQWTLKGKKMFCSGAGMVDRALMSVTASERLLIDVNLREVSLQTLDMTTQPWCTKAFEATQTSTLTFDDFPVNPEDIIGSPDWYINRVGFWQGALGPAACWGGGAAGLLDYAKKSKRNDPHTLVHLAAMEANIWAIQSYLQTAGSQIDTYPDDAQQAQKLALITRHLIEQCCTDVLRRFTRAYGPYPIACDPKISRRYLELDLFLRQSHAERDLEGLGKLITQADGNYH